MTSYKRIKDNAGKSKSGRGALERWPYFNALDDLLGRKASIRPDVVVEFGRSSESSAADIVPTAGNTSQNDSDSDQNGFAYNF